MEIDEQAPAIGRADIDIPASPEDVWEVLSDITSWSSWNPDVKQVQLLGPLCPGTPFTWEAGGSRISSRLHVVDQPRELGWTGRTRGIYAEHVYRLEARGGGTHVVTEESWAGFMARLMPRRLTSFLQRSLEKGLGYLEAELGRRAIAAAARDLEASGHAGEAGPEVVERPSEGEPPRHEAA